MLNAEAKLWITARTPNAGCGRSTIEGPQQRKNLEFEKRRWENIWEIHCIVVLVTIYTGPLDSGDQAHGSPGEPRHQQPGTNHDTGLQHRGRCVWMR